MSNVANTPEITPPPALTETSLIDCVDCGSSVFEWSTPHPDRCWECAEIVDLEAGR